MRDLAELERDMRACEQTPGLSVWRHGEMVAERYAELLGFLRAGAAGQLPGWRMPSWAAENAQLLVSRQVDFDTAQRYQLFHDCGKPYVVEVDENGRRHFPGHSAASGALWLRLGGAPVESELMAQDMDAHLLPAADLPEFSARPTAATLLLTALCEVHANAEMFGGLESVGFKSKWKHLDRRGRALVNLWR